MSIKQISIFLENKPGALYAMTGVLAQHNVDMRALSLAETKDFGIVRLIVDNVYEATTVLKDAGYVHSVTPVLGVAIPDTPGGLNKVLQVLTNAKVNVEYMYAFLGGKDVDHAYMIFRVADNAAASAALAAQGIQVVEQEEIEKLRDNFLRVETQSAFDSPEQAEHVILEHRGILEAIREGNEKEAVKAMRYHLDCTTKRTLNHIIAELDEEL